MGRGSRSNPLEPIAARWQRNPHAPGTFGNSLANRDMTGSRLPDRTNQTRKSTGDERESSNPLQTTSGIDWSVKQTPFAGDTLGVPTALPQCFHHLRVSHKQQTAYPIGAMSLGILDRRERSRATGQPSSQITLRPASVIEKNCSKGLSASANGL